MLLRKSLSHLRNLKPTFHFSTFEKDPTMAQSFKSFELDNKALRENTEDILKNEIREHKESNFLGRNK
jgi:isocitrate/isopropylmalate dehydrogenase